MALDNLEQPLHSIALCVTELTTQT